MLKSYRYYNMCLFVFKILYIVNTSFSFFIFSVTFAFTYFFFEFGFVVMFFGCMYFLFSVFEIIFWMLLMNVLLFKLMVWNFRAYGYSLTRAFSVFYFALFLLFLFDVIIVGVCVLFGVEWVLCVLCSLCMVLRSEVLSGVVCFGLLLFEVLLFVGEDDVNVMCVCCDVGCVMCWVM